MKGMLDSSESFTAYATIDAGMYMLGALLEKIGKPKSPLVAMIDESSGYSLVEYNGWIDTAVSILNDIIDAKKQIEVDYSSDEKLISDLNNLKR